MSYWHELGKELHLIADDLEEQDISTSIQISLLAITAHVVGAMQVIDGFNGYRVLLARQEYARDKAMLKKGYALDLVAEAEVLTRERVRGNITD